MPVFSTNIGTPMKSDKSKFCFVCKKQFDSHDILCVTDKNGKQKLYHQICYDTSPTEKYKELNEDQMIILQLIELALLTMIWYKLVELVDEAKQQF